MREKWRIMCVLFSSPIPDPQSHSTARYPLPRFEFLGRQSHCLLRLLLLSLVSLSGSARASWRTWRMREKWRIMCVLFSKSRPTIPLHRALSAAPL